MSLRHPAYVWLAHTYDFNMSLIRVTHMFWLLMWLALIWRMHSGTCQSYVWLICLTHMTGSLFWLIYCFDSSYDWLSYVWVIWLAHCFDSYTVLTHVIGLHTCDSNDWLILMTQVCHSYVWLICFTVLTHLMFWLMWLPLIRVIHMTGSFLWLKNATQMYTCDTNVYVWHTHHSYVWLVRVTHMTGSYSWLEHLTPVTHVFDSYHWISYVWSIWLAHAHDSNIWLLWLIYLTDTFDILSRNPKS